MSTRGSFNLKIHIFVSGQFSYLVIFFPLPQAPDFVCCIFLDFWLVSILIIYWLVTNHSKTCWLKHQQSLMLTASGLRNSEHIADASSLLLHVWPHWLPTPKGAHTVKQDDAGKPVPPQRAAWGSSWHAAGFLGREIWETEAEAATSHRQASEATLCHPHGLADHARQPCSLEEETRACLRIRL